MTNLAALEDVWLYPYSGNRMYVLFKLIQGTSSLKSSMLSIRPATTEVERDKSKPKSRRSGPGEGRSAENEAEMSAFNKKR